MTNKKIATPVDPLIFQVAGEMCATMYDTGRSQGMTSKYKNEREYVKAYIEKYIPIAVKTLIQMLKPTSNCTEHMRQRIHEALTNPINDPDLMEGKKNGLPNINANLIAEAQRKFEKNVINLNTAIKPEIKTVIHK